MVIRVLLADDQRLFRAGIKAALESERAIEIVGEAAMPTEAIEKTEELRPDVVVIDIASREDDAIAAIRTIRERWPSTQVLVLTSRAIEDWFRKAAAAGAIGYVLKDIEPVNLANAIRAAHLGKTMLSPTIATQLVHRHYATSTQSSKEQPNLIADSDPKLTPNEIEVLTLMVQGLSDKEIASKLFLSEAAVKSRLRNLYRRLGLRNRAQVAAFAVGKWLC